MDGNRISEWNLRVRKPELKNSARPAPLAARKALAFVRAIAFFVVAAVLSVNHVSATTQIIPMAKFNPAVSAETIMVRNPAPNVELRLIGLRSTLFFIELLSTSSRGAFARMCFWSQHNVAV
jgi:hypothetical protein